MARNTRVAVDTQALPITGILARFVAGHSARGRSDAAEREAHRTFYNWVGCAIGAARHEAADAMLAAATVLVNPHDFATAAHRCPRGR
jgi:hypothetical protein